MSSKIINESQDFDFLQKSFNLDEFKINCTLYSIDIKDAVKALSFFEDNGRFCIALDHFYWFDEDGNEIDAPKEVGGNFDCSFCTSLASLEGAPRKIGRYLDHENTKLTSSQVQAYLDWLKTSPKENYHELKLSESMSFIRSIMRGNDDEAKALLESMMKKKVTKMIKQALGI